ncbi:DUF6276 family protein [Halobacterium salinarum]|uniref:Small CPxCG-related zinc finger protein n=1 Tax=Halobacterium salinarum (strain ATCC 33171 / DSM 3754 / JCM 8978 / NBRC 102687 / NCIMB 764 / 91-R6) TaxID=2597657 RepID=A0A4D6GW89_HALS9|nr:DUF6276 family protein [Halobacterium salinarum]MDL0144744.1 DUF6276 family protein [Halobacterium salinarum]QCC45761.1 small CPxCG-related zinc finger protein [Halobacterium salinarum]TYO82019.1 hypothetical protein APQ99_00535 [Halobacterium salinarum DSM 3754]
MTCSNCGCPVVSFPIPASVSDCLPDDRPGAVLCTQCLRVAPTDDPPDDYPDFARASDAFPADGETAAVLACLLALVDRLALHRADADAVAGVAERHGVDVLLFLDRLAADTAVTPAVDVSRRRTQLAQLI